MYLMEIETIDLTPLDTLFRGSIVHLTGGPGVGKSLLLLYYLGHKSLQKEERVLWVDAGGSFPPNRVKVLFGRDAPAVLAHMLVAKASSLSHMKAIAAELASRGGPPGTTRVVIDPISRIPRHALTSTANSAGQGRFIADDFFASVIEPLLVAATRDGFQIILVHEDSQDHPFWWNRYPSRENRVHLQKDPFQTSSREISNGRGERVAYLDMSHNPINIIRFSQPNSDEEAEDDFDE